MHASFTNKNYTVHKMRENNRKVVQYDICMKLLVEEDAFCMVFCDKKYLACQLAYKIQSARIEGYTSIKKKTN